MAGRTKKKTYEEALNRLEEIAQLMEEGDIGLEESVKLYKEGVELSLFCSQKLEKAEQEVAILQKSAAGTFESKPFFDEEV
jgi:exodeoxyribonuclease VII small subunit